MCSNHISKNILQLINEIWFLCSLALFQIFIIFSGNNTFPKMIFLIFHHSPLHFYCTLLITLVQLHSIKTRMQLKMNFMTWYMTQSCCQCRGKTYQNIAIYGERGVKRRDTGNPQVMFWTICCGAWHVICCYHYYMYWLIYLISQWNWNKVTKCDFLMLQSS